MVGKNVEWRMESRKRWRPSKSVGGNTYAVTNEELRMSTALYEVVDLRVVRTP